MKRESIVIAVGAPVLTWFLLSKIVPGSASQGVLSMSVVMILVNLTTLKGSVSVQLQEKQASLDALDRLMAGRGWWRKTTKSDDLLYRAPMLLSLFVADLDVDFSAANTVTLSGPQWLVRGLEVKLGKT